MRVSPASKLRRRACIEFLGDAAEGVLLAEEVRGSETAGTHTAEEVGGIHKNHRASFALVIIGAAFSAIVASFVADIFTPILGLLGIPDFSTWAITLGEAEMRIGLFLNAVIYFVIVAAVIFFGVIKPMNRLMPKAEEEAAGASEVELLTEIRDELRKKA